MAMYLGSNKVEIGVNNGDGGSSDFSTATLTFVNQTSGAYLSGSFTEVIDLIGDTCLYTFSGLYQSREIIVPLFKGFAYYDGVRPTGGNFVDTSGACDYDSINQVLGITGDCTITLTGDSVPK